MRNPLPVSNLRATYHYFANTENLIVTMRAGCFLGKHFISYMGKNSANFPMLQKIDSLTKDCSLFFAFSCGVRSFYKGYSALSNCLLSAQEPSYRRTAYKVVLGLMSMDLSLLTTQIALNRLQVFHSSCRLISLDFIGSLFNMATRHSPARIQNQGNLKSRSFQFVLDQADNIHGVFFTAVAAQRAMKHLLYRSELKAQGPVRYLFKELGGSRPWIRLIKGVIGTVQDNGMTDFFGLTLSPIREVGEKLDGVFSIGCIFEGAADVYDHGFKWDRKEIFKGLLDLVADSFDTLKWMGENALIERVAPYSRSFGYIKNICSVACSVLNIQKAGEELQSAYVSNDKDRNYKMMIATMNIIRYSCSLWLNSIGGSKSYWGAEAFSKIGIGRLIRDSTFNAVGLLLSTTTIAKKTITA